MKNILIILLFLIIFIITAFIVLGYSSRSGEAEGISEGRLTLCPDKPNCICSEYKNDTEHFIDPVIIPDITAGTLDVLRDIIKETGGTIQTERRDYIGATFSSAVFGFVDDLEIRIDYYKNEIHFRSASRVGYSDMGVNRKRIESIKALFLKKKSMNQPVRTD